MHSNNLLNYFFIKQFHFKHETFAMIGIIFAALGFYLLNKAYAKRLNEEVSTGIEA